MVDQQQLSHRKRLQRRIVATVALLAALACGLLLLQPRQAPAAAAPFAPDFTLPTASGNGQPLSLRALRGHPLLLNFFNSQCAPCLDELPALRQTVRAYQAKGIRVIGIATGGDTVASARALARAAHLPYTVAVDVHQSVAWRYDVGGWPTSFFVDARGRMQAQWVGPLDAQTVRAGLAQVGAIECSSCDALSPPSLVADQPATGAAPSVDADVVYNPAPLTYHFSLRDQNGKLITPRSLRGKAVALTFVSALCKEQCPLVGKALTMVRKGLGKDAAKLSIVAISVDPEIDTPTATRQFAKDSAWQDADWHYLTASRPVLSRIWHEYGIDVEAPPPIFKPTTSIVHQAELFLVDPQGRLRAYYDVPFLPSRVVTTIRALL
jgi:cytochrome oxidase Cu insertion factor (SCO1/SenC/PrrC family)